MLFWENLLNVAAPVRLILFPFNVLILNYLPISSFLLCSNLRSAVIFDMTDNSAIGPIKIEMASKLMNENNKIVSGPIKDEVIPQAIAEIAISNILSGRCIHPTLQSTPNPSALARV
ncbi:MAG: hypothetical protein ACI8VT_003696 [Saprospiraceae bacterium]|jgi:hypothetical protein